MTTTPDPTTVNSEETIVVDVATPLKATKVATVFYAYDEGCDDTGIYGDGYFAHFDDALWATARTYANEEYGLYRTPPKPLTWRKHHHLWRLHDGNSPTDIVVSDSPLLGSRPDEQPHDERDDDVRAGVRDCPCGCVGGPDDCTCGGDCHCSDCLTCDPGAIARRAAAEAERPADEDHRGDDAKDCPACSAFRHRTEQVLGVRAVDNAIKAITLFWSGEVPIETLAEARAQLIEHYGNQIATFDAAALDARDAKGGEVR